MSDQLEQSAVFQQQIDRLKEATTSKSDADLARILDIKPQGVALARKKIHIPPVWFVTISDRYHVSIDWLIYGEGEKERKPGARVNEPPDPGRPNRKSVPIKEARLEAFRLWVEDIAAEDPAYRDWASIELVRRFPEFEEWLKKRETTLSKDSEGAIRNAS